MSLPKPEPLCRYHYDPLDRLASSAPLGQADARCFYRKNKLTTEIQGQIRTSWLETDDQLLAQWRQEAGKHEALLIATDSPGSVIHTVSAAQQQAFAYTPYGAHIPYQAPLHLPGFNGERRDPVTGHYLLGNGYRAFNPVLMRFNSPDSLSPFGEGGLNAYAYCGGDPVNQTDTSGHIGVGLAVLRHKQFKASLTAFKPFPKAEHTTSLLKENPVLFVIPESTRFNVPSVNHHRPTFTNPDMRRQRIQTWIESLPPSLDDFSDLSPISHTIVNRSSSIGSIGSRSSITSTISDYQLSSHSSTSGNGMFKLLPDEERGIGPGNVIQNRVIRSQKKQPRP